MRIRNKWAAATALSTMLVSLLTVATPASAATMPAYEPDPNSIGSLSFYDSTGNLVTSGTDLSHLFDYAVASTEASRPGTTKATLNFSFPDHTKPDSQTWFTTQGSPSTVFPNPNAPAPVNTFGRRPVATALTQGDANLSAVLPTTILDQTDGYKDLVQVRVKDSGPGLGNGVQSVFWSTDIMFDRTANTWQQVYPAVATTTATTTTLTTSPASPQAPGTNVTLTASVSPSAAAGSVQFKDGTTNLGAPVAVSGGTATYSTTALAQGSHSLTATFIPTDPTAFSASTSAAKSYLIATVPGAPTNVRAIPSNGYATVSWTAPADNGGSPVTGYVVAYSTDGGGTYTRTTQNFSTSTATSQDVSGLRNGTAYVFRVSAINAVGTGPASAPSSPPVTPTADSSALTISAPLRVYYYRLYNVTGRLTDTRTARGIPSASLALYRRPSKYAAFTYVARYTTNAYGYYSATVRATANAQYQVRYAGNVSHKAVNSYVRTIVAVPTIVAARTAATVHRGAYDRFYGYVNPASSGNVVYLQRFYGGRWHTVSGKIAIKYQRLPSGRSRVGFQIAVRFTVLGVYTYRIYKPATASFGGSTSGNLGVRVIR